METPTTEDLTNAFNVKERALYMWRKSRGQPMEARQQHLDAYVDAAAVYEWIRAQTTDAFFTKHPEMDASMSDEDGENRWLQ